MVMQTEEFKVLHLSRPKLFGRHSIVIAFPLLIAVMFCFGLMAYNDHSVVTTPVAELSQTPRTSSPRTPDATQVQPPHTTLPLTATSASSSASLSPTTTPQPAINNTTSSNQVTNPYAPNEAHPTPVQYDKTEPSQSGHATLQADPGLHGLDPLQL